MDKGGPECGGTLNLGIEGRIPRQEKMKSTSTVGEDEVLAADEDGMKAEGVPNQALVSLCLLVTLWDSLLIVFVSYTARQYATPDT